MRLVSPLMNVTSESAEKQLDWSLQLQTQAAELPPLPDEDWEGEGDGLTKSACSENIFREIERSVTIDLTFRLDSTAIEWWGILLVGSHSGQTYTKDDQEENADSRIHPMEIDSHETDDWVGVSEPNDGKIILS